MSTTETKKRGALPAVALMVCLATLATLCWIVYRQILPAAPETVSMYVASFSESATVYYQIDDPDTEHFELLPRGTEVQCVAEDLESGAEKVRFVSGEGYMYLDRDSLVSDYADTVLTDTVYAVRGMSLLDETGVTPLCAVEKGMALDVLGFDGMDDTGHVERWHVSCRNGEGYIKADYTAMTEDAAQAQYDEALYQVHAARGDSWGGGDAAGLDYYPTEAPEFDNKMPDEVRALYLNGSAIQYADSYLSLAKDSAINAFVVDIVDGTAVSYASPVMEAFSPSAYAAAQDTMENFRANVQKLKAAGYYLIGRITVFNDAHLAADHPEYVISDLEGTPLKISSMYWPSGYNRAVWQYKVDLALEAAALGFDEIQFDYIRFPDGAYKYEQAGTIDYKNTYGESKAQAVQRFLIYATERLHDAGYYVSGDVFGECANAYVTACGQYWPAISSVVDAISGMPYPDHYSASDDYKPWEHPYTTVLNFGESAMARQSETLTPAAVRTWIQCYNAIREPYNHYGVDELADEVKALRDSGCTGGFMTWNGASDIDKYREVLSGLA